jgi:hypothetical protein
VLDQMKRITKQPQEEGSETWQNLGIRSKMLTWNMLVVVVELPTMWRVIIWQHH